MHRTMLAGAACLLLCTSAAFAQDVDAETRFHRAYEQEVVDGKTAEAARVYLEMMGDEKVSERLRQEAKFRFAVTAVLLGRAARVRAGRFDERHDREAVPIGDDGVPDRRACGHPLHVRENGLLDYRCTAFVHTARRPLAMPLRAVVRARSIAK